MTASQRPSGILTSLRTGLFGLRLQAWIRRQPRLKQVYRFFPQAVRDRVTAALSARATMHTRFQRTAAWEQTPTSATSWRRRNWEPSAARVPGVNIIGYIRGEFGLAESARMYARALINAGIPVALHDLDLGLPHSWQDHSMDEFIDERLPHRVSIVFVNPDYLDAAFDRVGRARMEGHYVIACWFWELEVVPASWLKAIDMVDEIMVASQFLEDAFRQVTGKPIMRVPPPLSEWRDSGLQRSDFGLESHRFVFLCTFDFHSFMARKNPHAVVRSFKAAFPSDRGDVCLLVKSSNGHMYPDGMRDLLASAAGDPRILVRDEVIDRAHVHALQRCCDAYVSLHRAEGFGLGLAECMALGKPVIATAWSGNMEFMTAGNSCLVDYELVPVDGQYPDSSRARWAEASTASAAEAMRWLADNPARARALGEVASTEVRDQLSPDRAAQRLLARLVELEPVPD
ncbi:glycosyltransferase family 4 protein [Xanthomonas hyacinthi]|uniref:Glycosyl transferase n=1 Tax=Xanthomonas hyacinthi TaxID=56455 RepID=A0A2S7F3M3_9XANT|nr:glycosyltransferase family 4 protein [Xanthomonas hyacinthi]KLD73495.1 glycosyl transferase [Xanthomonas hyacinthi DSM 19077]PPU99988.1 glycosyl transferase [Xanthomonas hyacinthi]QGY76168.1 glycosyltransferase family 4 protein [Xanthomonas hyacinthi]